MDRRRLVARLQRRQPRQIGCERIHLIARHHQRRAGERVRRIARQREHERARAPCRHVLAAQQRIKRGERGQTVARDRLAQRQAPHRFVTRRRRQRQLIVGLRPPRVAAQVAREPAIGGDARHGHAQAYRVTEIAQRAARIAALQESLGKAGLDLAVARVACLRPRQETGRRVHLAHRQRGLARAQQSRHIVWLGRQHAQVARQGLRRVAARRRAARRGEQVGRRRRG